jgi:nitrogen fixation NifU-like protein
MSELRELYQEVILDHGKHPRNFAALEPPCQQAEGHNPVCGDRVTVFVRLDGGRLSEVRFQGSGCAICMASASLMTERLRGRTVEESERVFSALHDLVAGCGVDPTARAELGKLEVLEGVRRFPLRVKCATLAWHTLRQALAGDAQTVTTERERP